MTNHPNRNKRRSITARTGHRLCGDAYDYAQLGSKMVAEGHESEGEGVKAIARRLGDIGRGLLSKLEGGAS